MSFPRPRTLCLSCQHDVRIRGLTRFIGFQTRYKRSLESDVQPMCAEHGFGIVPWPVLSEGFLTGKHARDQKDSNSKRQDQVHAHHERQELGHPGRSQGHCSRMQTDPAQVATNWVLQKPGIISPLLPTARSQNSGTVGRNLGALEFTLSPQQMACLDSVSNPRSWPFPQDVARNLERFTAVGIQIEMPQRYHAVQSLRTSKI